VCEAGVALLRFDAWSAHLCKDGHFIPALLAPHDEPLAPVVHHNEPSPRRRRTPLASTSQP